MAGLDPSAVVSSLSTDAGDVQLFSLQALEKKGLGQISSMPRVVKIFAESVVRHLDGESTTEEHLENLLGWRDFGPAAGEFPYQPSRVLMQDFTGVPAVVDLAVMRDAMTDLGGDPRIINPIIPVDLVIDHSVQVDRYGSGGAFAYNAEREFQRNRERYEILNWASKAFKDFTVVPPATGICHQVNLEYLAKVVGTEERDGRTTAFPDTLVGTDSHTTMINGLGVLGWGVGGIEAEAAMLGQPIHLPVPEVIGVRFSGSLRPGVTATDLVLRVTQLLREYGVVGRYVEFFGPGLDSLDLADRATISNMCPEYGATAAYFPVDDITLSYLRGTGRSAALVDLVERYTKEQGLFRAADSPDPVFTDIVELDMESIVPSIAGPRRPQDRIAVSDAKRAFADMMNTPGGAGASSGEGGVTVRLDENVVTLDHGAVVIAAITSCTNTSNPSVMIGAGLLAKRAVELGLRVPVYVKTSLAPGSKVVTRYLELSGLMPYLEALGFHLVGFGCTTCIGNSGPLRPEISEAITKGELTVASVLSGNRNFEGRIHQEIRANYLASPPLVVAYALAGTMRLDLDRDPVGHDPNGEPVYLKDIWPDEEETRKLVREKVTPLLFEQEYGNVYTGNETWNAISFEGDGTGRYPWDERSTYIRKPPFFERISAEPEPVAPIRGARVLAVLGDSITTDHISPAGAIAEDSPAARWLKDHGVSVSDFNTYGSRRGNHEVMIRGTFGNIRIRNRLVPDMEGGYTIHLPDEAGMSIYDAATAYAEEGVPLVVIAGKDYGMGSSRDWAAKGTILLGVRAVLAESFERIHRSNLVGMGVLPLEFAPGESAESLGLSGREVLDIDPIRTPGEELTVHVSGGRVEEFHVKARVDNPVELEYYRNGGILHTVLRKKA